MKRFWLYLLITLAVGYHSGRNVMSDQGAVILRECSASLCDTASRQRDITASETVFTVPVVESCVARQNSVRSVANPSGRRHSNTSFDSMPIPPTVKNYPTVFPRPMGNAVANSSFCKAVDYYIYLLRKIII